jgi:flagellar biosynthesis protein FlhF
MKIKHYRAADMRQALRLVRDEQGPDAVILSSRRIQGGVEVVAAVDYDAQEGVDNYGRDHEAPATPRADEIARPHIASSAADTRSFVSATASRPNGVPDTLGVPHIPVGRTNRVPDTNGVPHIPVGLTGQAAVQSDFATLAQRLSAGQMSMSESPSDMNEELRTLRRMLETQLATLAWNDLSRRSPIQTELLKQLTVLGLAHDLAAELVTQLPARLELAESQRLALALISRRIEVSDERWLDDGGVVAMVGPTGVGKTTLIAKLAARWVLRHGTRDVALISTDSMRIGAQEQIHTLGRLLGVPAYAIDGPAELAELLDHLDGHRLVLIDTAGYSQRDPRVAAELQTLAKASSRLETCLVLSAAAQAGAIEEAVERFAAAQPGTCALTKLDEATSLGGSISMLIRARLPLVYVSDGQRVPEDISPARAHQLVARAVELSKKAGAEADEDLLRRRFGGVAHALA